MAFGRKRKPKIEKPLQPGQRRQTTAREKVGGKSVRVVITEYMRADGTVKVTKELAAILETDLQSAQVDALFKHPEFGRRFDFAGDQNSAKRGPQAQKQAKDGGMRAGEPDIRLYFRGGKTVFVENKVGKVGRLSDDQDKRHDDLTRLDFPVYTLFADSKSEAVDKILTILEHHLAQA